MKAPREVMVYGLQLREQPLVVSVRTDPEPDHLVIFHNADRTVI